MENKCGNKFVRNLCSHYSFQVVGTSLKQAVTGLTGLSDLLQGCLILFLSWGVKCEHNLPMAC